MNLQTLDNDVADVRCALQNAGRLLKLREMMDYVQDGSDTVVKLHQDDATRDFIVEVGERSYFGKTLNEAIEAAVKGEEL